MTMGYLGLAFVAAVAEAALVWWIVDRGNRGRVAFLEERLRAHDEREDRLIDKVQSPTAKEFVARQEAAKAVVEAKTMTGEELAAARVAQEAQMALENAPWERMPEFADIEVTRRPGTSEPWTVVDHSGDIPIIEHLTDNEWGIRVLAAMRSRA